MTEIDSSKALAELPILRDFVEFINQQVGVYCDCLSGFYGNKVRIERQVARVTRPVSQRIEHGQPVIVWASLEDPTLPDVIHHRIIRASDFADANSEAGFNEQQVCWAVIVFLFAFWDEEVRPRIAKIRGVKPNQVQIQALGELRIFRKAIVHNGGVMRAADHAKLQIMSELAKPDAKITFTHDEMHKVFVEIKRVIGNLILDYTGHLPDAPKAGDIVDLAFQNVPRN